jgi:putative tricarboxylic transport membrane protein
LKIRPAAIFSFCAFIFFCVFVYQAQEWRMQARLYPWAIGIPMLILAAIQVILDFKGVKAKQSTDGAPPTPMDFQFTQEVEPAIAKKRAITMFAWLFGFFVAVLLVGFSIAIPLMMFTYMKFQGKESWVLSLVLTVIAFIFYYALFVRVLNLPFPEGLLLPWLGLNA